MALQESKNEFNEALRKQQLQHNVKNVSFLWPIPQYILSMSSPRPSYVFSKFSHCKPLLNLQDFKAELKQEIKSEPGVPMDSLPESTENIKSEVKSEKQIKVCQSLSLLTIVVLSSPHQVLRWLSSRNVMPVCIAGGATQWRQSKVGDERGAEASHALWSEDSRPEEGVHSRGAETDLHPCY